MKKITVVLFPLLMLLAGPLLQASEHADAIAQDYQAHLAPLWDYFHRNPELSLMEFNTSERLAEEIRAAGFEVTEGVGGTGIVAIMETVRGL